MPEHNSTQNKIFFILSLLFAALSIIMTFTISPADMGPIAGTFSTAFAIAASGFAIATAIMNKKG